jgi:hypothetical protein
MFGSLVLQAGPPVLTIPIWTGDPSARWAIAGPPLSPKQPPFLLSGGSTVHICRAVE